VVSVSEEGFHFVGFDGVCVVAVEGDSGAGVVMGRLLIGTLLP
jgi:hypothetical protein